MTAPTLVAERGLAASVVGMDEVGRGALAGPVCVGAVLVGAATGSVPEGLRDSKLLTVAARERLVGPVRDWATAWAVGFASAAEVDACGIVAALRLAGRRALAELGTEPDVVLLDGSHDWLSDPMEQGLLAGPGACPPVVTRVKADLTCASVAAASVLAKVARDAVLVALEAEHPHYGFAANKGYASATHIEALATRGPCGQHRRSWRLPGVVYGGADDEGAIGER